jgi:hypothetical protein
MAFIIRNAAGEIKTYMELAAGTVLEEGEILEETPQTFADYSKRLRISVEGTSGEVVRVPSCSGIVTVRVDCPGQPGIALDVNGLVETLPLIEGTGGISLSREVPGMFIIRPADRTEYCSAGESLCMVLVEEQE